MSLTPSSVTRKAGTPFDGDFAVRDFLLAGFFGALPAAVVFAGDFLATGLAGFLAPISSLASLWSTAQMRSSATGSGVCPCR